MKKIYCFLISIFVASCSTFAPEPTAMPQTDFPASPVPSQEQTKTPVPTEEPTARSTEDRDPSIPVDYTKDASGNYTKTVTENGETVTYTWTVVKNKEGDILFEGGVVEKTEGKGVGIGAYDTGQTPYAVDEYGRIQFFASENAIGAASMPQILHIEYTKDRAGNEIDITGITSGLLWKRIYPGVRYDNTVLPEFMYKVMAGTMPFPFETSSGEIEEWFISPEHGANVYAVDFDSISQDFEFTDASPVKIKFRMEIKGIDSDGQLVILIATDQPWESLTRFQYQEAIFAGPAHVINGKESNGKTIGGLSKVLFDWCAWSNEVSQSTGEQWLELDPAPVRDR